MHATGIILAEVKDREEESGGPSKKRSPSAKPVAEKGSKGKGVSGVSSSGKGPVLEGGAPAGPKKGSGGTKAVQGRKERAERPTSDDAVPSPSQGKD